MKEPSDTDVLVDVEGALEAVANAIEEGLALVRRKRQELADDEDD
jgi:microcompartment protein CcmL/EutN